MNPGDVWAIGDAYERYMGRWSRLVAGRFINWAGVPAGGRWLEVGCGTGALTEAVLGLGAPALVLATDPSPGFLSTARARVRDRRAEFLVAEAGRLPVQGGRWDAVVSGLVLNFIPAPEAGLREMVRAVRPGGLVGGYVWDYAGRMEFLRHFWDAAVALDPAAAELDEGRRFAGFGSEGLSRLFVGAGLARVEVTPIDVRTPFRSFADLWEPFLGGQGPAPAYVAGLSPDRRDALRERLRRAVSPLPDGSVRLTARAWAVRGYRPPMS